MANSTDPFAQSVRGTNPQFLIEKITRMKIHNCTYWKEECFGLTAATLLDKAINLKYSGGTYGGNNKPTKFICLVLKLLQLQPEKEIILEYIANEEFKYVRALGAFYFRLVGKAEEVYRYLEPLYNDYRKIVYRGVSGWSTLHMDEFIENLLCEELYCDIALPHIAKRFKLEELGVLAPRQSILDEELDEMERLEAIELRAQAEAMEHRENHREESSQVDRRPETVTAAAAAVTFEDSEEESSAPNDRVARHYEVLANASHRVMDWDRRGADERDVVADEGFSSDRDRDKDKKNRDSRDRERERDRDRDSRDKDRKRHYHDDKDSRDRGRGRTKDRDRDSSSSSRDDYREQQDSRERTRDRGRRPGHDKRDSRREHGRRSHSRSRSRSRSEDSRRRYRHSRDSRDRKRSDHRERDRDRDRDRKRRRSRSRSSSSPPRKSRDDLKLTKYSDEDHRRAGKEDKEDLHSSTTGGALQTQKKSKNEKVFDRVFGKKSSGSSSAAAAAAAAGPAQREVRGKVITNDKGEKFVITASEGSVEYWNQVREALGMSKLK